MILITQASSIENAYELIKLNAPAISLALKDFSVRSNYYFTIEQISKLVKNKNKTKIYICINKIFFDPELVSLTSAIKKICKLKIDGIIYTDLGVNQILYENKIKIEQIYDSITLATNYGQFPFYKKNDISIVFLPTQLSSKNVYECCKNKKNIKLGLQVAGHEYMMWSRWQLISNFVKSHKLNKDILKNKLYISEKKRANPCIITEDRNGTYVTTGYNLNLLQSIPEMIKNKLDYVFLNTYLHDDEWVISFYNEISKTITNKKYEPSDSFLQLVKKETQSAGFFSSNLKDLIYFSK